jgi:hypothetical protein
MKNLYILISLLPSFLMAQTWDHTSNFDPISLHNKARISYEQTNNAKSKDDTIVRKGILEGEYKLGNSFSLVSSIGQVKKTRTDSTDIVYRENYNLGIKTATSWSKGDQLFLIGGGLRYFSHEPTTIKTASNTPELDRIILNFGMGYQAGQFQSQFSLAFDTETNAKMVEKRNEEFKRFKILNVHLGYKLNDQWKPFVEFIYKEPVQRVQDADLRYFRAYPGIQYSFNDQHKISISAYIPIRHEATVDRGYRIQYFYFF